VNGMRKQSGKEGKDVRKQRGQSSKEDRAA
jgi:hypothetical protein